MSIVCHGIATARCALPDAYGRRHIDAVVRNVIFGADGRAQLPSWLVVAHRC
jgi:hypothetical protein